MNSRVRDAEILEEEEKKEKEKKVGMTNQEGKGNFSGISFLIYIAE